MSGTATTDFGGSKNAGIVVGIVDGIVYLGTGLQSVIIGILVPTGEAATQSRELVALADVLTPICSSRLCVYAQDLERDSGWREEEARHQRRHQNPHRANGTLASPSLSLRPIISIYIVEAFI